MDKMPQAPTKPLFASAEAISYSVSSHSERKNDGPLLDESSDLEKLNLNLASSTLEAILAVQKRPEAKPVPALQSCSGKSSSESEERVSAVAQSFSGDEEVDLHPSRPKKRKSTKERRRRKKEKKKRKDRRYRSRSPELEERDLRHKLSQVYKGNEGFEFDSHHHQRPEKTFQIDRKANKDLKTYESVSKRHIAQYKLACVNCIGNTNVRVDFQREDDCDKKMKKKNFGIKRYFRKDSVKQIWRKGYSFASSSSSSNFIGYQPEFIHIPETTDGNSNNNAIGSYSCLDEATALYVQGKGKLLSGVEADDNFVMDELYAKVASFNQRTREDPQNVKLWLEFVKFQDIVALEDKSFKKQTVHLRDVYRPSRSVIEKKLSILEKANELNPSSLELKQAQLELYQDVWESDKVEKAWEDLLFVHSSNVDLWRHYLSRQQSRLSTFSFSKVVKKYHKCFQTLIPIMEGQVKVATSNETLEEKMIGLFYQYCMFLGQSGYTERAVTCFQAMVEMNLFCPSGLNLASSNERRVKLESFWESSASKFGDLNAKGWTEWEKKKEEDTRDIGFLPASSEQEEDSIISAGLPKSLTWLKMEKLRQDMYWLPWKPDESKGETEDNCEDPDRLVLFEDISPALFRLTTSQGCVQLVCLFLSFLGMKNARMEAIVDSVDGISKSSFSGYLLDKMHQFQNSSNLKLGLDFGMNWNPSQCLMDFAKQIILQAEAYFGTSNRDLFTLLRLDLERQKTGIANIQMLSASNRKELKKFGKNLLKESQNRNNLVVWDTYIRLLWVLSDKMDETVSMIDTALGMFIGSSSLSDPTKARGICLLCRTFAEILLNFEPLEYVTIKGRHSPPSRRDKQQVIGCMGALVEGRKFKPHFDVDSSPLAILRIRKRLANVLERFLADLEDGLLSSTCETIDAFLQCYALFEYCASDFGSGNEVFISTISLIKNKFFTDNTKPLEIDSMLKCLYISQMSFISNVMHIESIPLSYMREVLDHALVEFPENCHFHNIFLEVESGCFLAGRTRKFYEKQMKSSPSVANSVFAALSELKRLDTLTHGEGLQSDMSDTGLVHRIRSLFEHALELPVCAHCPLLWRMWLAFEMQHGTSARAKGILYRALQNCPWAKTIYMDGVECFREEELSEMCDLMTEKEIRVCMPLEEVDLLLNAEKESEEEGMDELGDTSVPDA